MTNNIFIQQHAGKHTHNPENGHLTRHQMQWYCQWIRDRLLNRIDAYVTFDRWGKKYSPIDFDRDPTKKKPLTPNDIVRHIVGDQSISLYAIGQLDTEQENRSKWVAWDLDNHGASEKVLGQNAHYAQLLADRLRHELGFDPLVESSDLRGGYHIWVLFDDFISSALAYRFSRWAVEKLCDWRDVLSEPPECFPKHDRLTGSRRYGISLRAPGRHPRHDGVWSAVLRRDESCYALWPKAIDEMLTYHGDTASRIPEEARRFQVSVRKDYVRPDRTLMSELYGSQLTTTAPNTVQEIFNQSNEWEDILEPHGWTITQRVGDTTYWQRPGKLGNGHSATTGHCGDLMYVFSSAAYGFEPNEAYSKFGAHAILNFEGDYEAAKAAMLTFCEDEDGGANDLD